jgi:hypothetical protein
MSSQLNRFGLATTYTTSVFHFGLFPQNGTGNLLSLEHNGFFREVFINGDNRVLDHIINSIDVLETYAGKVPVMQAVGSTSRRLLTLLASRNEKDVSSRRARDVVVAKVGRVIFFDRTKDLITPMMTPATYEALLEDVRQVIVMFHRLQ